jgi:hypothetical protein
MKASGARVRQAMSSQHPSVLVAAALLLIALAIAAVPSARGAARHLITGKDVQDHSIATVDLKDGSVNSHKILDGHVLARDLSRSLREQIAARAKNGKDGARGPAGPAGAPGPAGADGRSVTSAVIAGGDARCPSGSGGVAYTLGSQTVNVCNGKDGQSGADTTVQLTDAGAGWDSHAKATLDTDGWVHLTGYLTCNGPSGCDDLTLHLPANFHGGASKEVFQLQSEDNFSGAYDQVAGAIVVQGATLTVPDASTGVLNSLNVWLSGITYKGV